ncbi:MAG: PTS sugar transporter subunit IIA [Verrucomicrobiia bacterium]
MIRLTEVLLPEHIVAPSQSRTRAAVYREALALGEASGALAEGSVSRLVEVLLERDRVISTAIGDGVALPHAPVPGLKQGLVFLVRTEVPVTDCDPLDGRPVDLFVVVLTPEGEPGLHLRLLASIARVLSDPAKRDALDRAEGARAVLAALE